MPKRLLQGKRILPQWMQSVLLRFALAALFLIAVCVVPATAFAAGISGTVDANTTWNDGDATTGNVTITGGTESAPVVITVDGTVTLKNTVTVSSGYVKFTGGGTLRRATTFTDDDMITVSGANVTFENITIDGNNVSSAFFALDISGTSNIIINEGTIICNNVRSATRGSAIRADSATAHITMNGGEIKNNSQPSYGAIFLNKSGDPDACTFTMNGGSITGNTSTDEDTSYGGGAFYVRHATLTVNGGTISGNSVLGESSGKGGGIYCSSFGKLRLNGGVISDNTAPTGSGIFFSARTNSNAEMYIGGNTLISGNVVYLDSVSTEKFPYITSAIKNPLPLVTAVFSEGRVLAEGTSDYTLTEADMTKVNIKTADGTQYYAKLASKENQILMTATDPGYAAKWSVSYFGNGGTGSVTDDTAYDAENPQAVVMENGFLRSGYSFTGYNTKANGSGTAYQPGETITVSTDITLYAQWLKAQYPVAYVLTGLTTNGTATATHETEYTATLSAAAHYALPVSVKVEVGITTLTAGTDYTYSSDTGAIHIHSGKVTGNITITATGVSETYPVTYDANGGAGTMADGTATYGTALPLPACTFTAPAGQRFKEWAIGSATGTKVAAGSTHYFTADTTVYAVWENVSTEPDPIEYEITEGQNGEAFKNSTNGLGFTANGELDAFTDVFVDGQKLSDKHYTTRSGSTIVTLKASYLATLSVGRHTLRVSFTDGYAETTFTILAAAETPAAVPETGDDAAPILWLGLILLAGALLAASAVLRRRRLNG